MRPCLTYQLLYNQHVVRFRGGVETTICLVLDLWEEPLAPEVACTLTQVAFSYNPENGKIQPLFVTEFLISWQLKNMARWLQQASTREGVHCTAHRSLRLKAAAKCKPPNSNRRSTLVGLLSLPCLVVDPAVGLEAETQLDAELPGAPPPAPALPRGALPVHA